MTAKKDIKAEQEAAPVEYKVEAHSDPSLIDADYLNAHGAEGWVLVTFIPATSTLVFYRPL